MKKFAAKSQGIHSKLNPILVAFCRQTINKPLKYAEKHTFCLKQTDLSNICQE